MAIDTKAIKVIRERTGAGFLDVKNAVEEAAGDIEQAIELLKKKGAAKAAKKSGRIAAEGLSRIIVKGNNSIIIEVNCETDFVSQNKQFIKLTEDIANALIASKVETLDEALKIKIGKNSISKIIEELTVIIGEKISFRRFEKLTKKDSEVFGEYVHVNGTIGVILIIEGTDKELARDISMHIAAMNPTYISMDDIPKDIVAKEKKLIVDALPKDKPTEIKEKMAIGRLNKSLGELTLMGQTYVKDGKQSVQKFIENKKSKVINFVRFEVGEGIETQTKDFAQEVAEQMSKTA